MEEQYTNIERDMFSRKARMDQERILELRYYMEKKQRQRRLILISLFPFLLTLIALYFFFIPEANTVFIVSSIGATFVAAFFLYLQPESSRSQLPFEYSIKNDFKAEINNLRNRNFEVERQNRELKIRFDKIIKQIQSGSITGEFFSESDKAELLKKIQAKFESDTLVEYRDTLLSMMNEKLRAKGQEDVFLQISSRLEGEVQNLAKRGNVNLILGISTTLTGLGILGYSVFEAPILTNSIEIVAHFVPRLSLVILIEVFAYFFLKLYKQSLSEIKYFQNEITNIESKYLGLRLSLDSGNIDITDKVVHSLINTERNFILEKGQSTVEIENYRIEQEQSSNLLKVLNNAVSKIK